MSKNSNEFTKVWSPSLYDSNARFVSDLAIDVLNLLAPIEGEKILDLGCGDGTLTKVIKDFGCEVVGIDSSPEFVSSAINIGINAKVCDGQSFKYNEEFDAVFSNAALHWMLDQDSVISNVKAALKPNGRFVGEMGGYGNVTKIISSIESELLKYGLKGHDLNPWYLPHSDEYRDKLESFGFNVKCIGLVERPTKLPGDIGGWLDVFADSFFYMLTDKQKLNVRQNIINDLSSKIEDENGIWWADYVRLRFHAVNNTN
ncbi:class I SAM-dependent methyltransferase [Alphaproteobacteria bacterium]|nr:class I SAM-dependent methyltransferase [Alphaproteobacteria bacterium]